MAIYQDELDEVLAETSTENKTVIIAVINKAYVEGDKSMFDLFLDGFWHGDGTQGLVNHILIVATDPVSYNRCKFLRLHCYLLETEGLDFVHEETYGSGNYMKMMWRRTQFLGDDTDILWLRNPFFILSPNETFDFQIACDSYQGNKPCAVNNGFSFVRSNNKTISLYDTWYEKRKVYVGKNEQDVVEYLIRDDSDSDSNSCDDEFGLVRLFGDQKPYVELPPSGSPRAYSWSDDDSGCDDDHTVPVEKSDGFVCNTYRMDISKKTRCLDYDMFSQVAVEEYNRHFKIYSIAEEIMPLEL
ncbi:hypothetical protein RHGRI_008221 [Rhododendron griersonianum]|uniref:Nucleotide-diphospho-sugar transferase domain-containing protein n=1 Tax=Rhododendron griersonianum TaxID=479676 RepID=A0AAV6KZR5_9ERIC|nr:hypothetical protein RHGRI_008221 [Rhododendron griersonianum]